MDHAKGLDLRSQILINRNWHRNSTGAPKKCGSSGRSHQLCATGFGVAFATGVTVMPENGGLAKVDEMADNRLFDDIDRKMKEIFAQSPAADLEKNLRALVQSALGRLDLVTREEYDVQREVLARTRAKLEELEAKVAELESKAEGENRKSK